MCVCVCVSVCVCKREIVFVCAREVKRVRERKKHKTTFMLPSIYLYNAFSA